MAIPGVVAGAVADVGAKVAAVSRMGDWESTLPMVSTIHRAFERGDVPLGLIPVLSELGTEWD